VGYSPYEDVPPKELEKRSEQLDWKSCCRGRKARKEIHNYGETAARKGGEPKRRRSRGFVRLTESPYGQNLDKEKEGLK